VREENTTYGSSAWAKGEPFNTANSPSIPVLTEPAADAFVHPGDVHLDWNNSTIPTGTTLVHYHVQVADSAAFSPVLIDETSLTSEFLASLPYASSKWFWRVQAENNLGQYSSWSIVRSFKLTPYPPSPYMVSPIDTGTNTVYTNRPTFSWDCSGGGGNSYRLQVSKYASYSTKLIDVTTPTGFCLSDYTPTTDLPANTYLYWHVLEENATYGSSAWANGVPFTTANPPSIPVLTAPTNGQLITNYRPTLEYHSTMPPGVVLDYYGLQVADNPYFDSPLVSESTYSNTSYVFYFDLTPNTTYYWRVQAHAIWGQYSSWSPVSTFRAAMLPPTLLTPADGAPTTDHRPVFTWNTVTGATGYQIMLSTSSTFLTSTTYPVSSPTFRPAASLSAATWYWKVRATGPNGPSLWSEQRSVVIQ
jgi:hypothetical protein